MFLLPRGYSAFCGATDAIRLAAFLKPRENRSKSITRLAIRHKESRKKQ